MLVKTVKELLEKVPDSAEFSIAVVTDQKLKPGEIQIVIDDTTQTNLMTGVSFKRTTCEFRYRKE
jgi:hypothetical protein